MKLKYIDIKGHGVLVDESAPIKEGDYMMFNETSDIVKCTKSDAITVWSKYSQYDKEGTLKVIFAEKELNLDVPILPDWREWEVEKEGEVETNLRILKHETPSHIARQFYEGFIAGHNHKKAKYTEEDLRKACSLIFLALGDGGDITTDEVIQSLQKVPKYIVMETEYNHDDSVPYPKTVDGKHLIPKLITNSEGKQEGIIKQIIW